MDEQTTLRDTLSAAMEQHEPEVTASTEVEVSADRTRDEQGRFAKKQEEQQERQAVQPVAQGTAEPPAPSRPPRPSSWKKDYDPYWEQLDPKVAEYINQRESEYAKGVSTYKNQWDQAQPIYEAMQPFMPDLQQHGIQPAQWIQNLGNAHKTLALGTPEQKLQMFARLANDYGVPLQALTGGQADPQVSQMMQELNQLRSQWQQFQTQREQQEAQALQSEIQKFAVDKPHFEAVRETMSQLLQSGVATDLQSAYDKAIRLHDDIFQQQQAEQAKAAEEERQRQLAEKKAKAVSTRSASPTAATNGGNGKKGLRDMLEEQVSQALGGRV